MDPLVAFVQNHGMMGIHPRTGRRILTTKDRSSLESRIADLFSPETPRRYGQWSCGPSRRRKTFVCFDRNTMLQCIADTGALHCLHRGYAQNSGSPVDKECTYETASSAVSKPASSGRISYNDTSTRMIPQACTSEWANVSSSLLSWHLQ